MHVLFTESLIYFFFHFFHIFNLDFFAWFCGAWFRVCSMYLVGATPATVMDQSFWNFKGVLVMVWRYACAFYKILK